MNDSQAENRQEKQEDEQTVNAICQTLSPARMAPYLVAAGHKKDRAMEIYLWNARVGSAFHFPIQICEVALRNRIERVLQQMYGAEWFSSKQYCAVIDAARTADLDQAAQRIRNRKQNLCADQVVATLSFGFWVGMLEPRYNPPIWGANLRLAFPGLPKGRARKSVLQKAQSVLTLRNRIFHHEPLIRIDLSGIHTDLCELLHWLCPPTAQWVFERDNIQALLREKP